MTRPRPQEDAVRERLRDEEPLASPVDSEPEPGEESAGASEPGPGEAPGDAAAEVEAAADGDGAGEGEPAGGGPTVPDPLAEAERQRDEYLALAQRTQADFENYRRRAARDTAAAGARATAALVRDLLPVVDNLERALSNAADPDDGLAQGVRLVHSELLGALERSGVAAFEPTGERFDPTMHEAISTRPADGAEAGVVVDVVEKGYRIDRNVLRPARVVVSQ